MYRGTVGVEQLYHAARTIRGIGHVLFSTHSQPFHGHDQVVTLGKSPVQVLTRVLSLFSFPPSRSHASVCRSRRAHLLPPSSLLLLLNTTQHNTTQHNTTQHNTTQHNTTRPSHDHQHKKRINTIGGTLKIVSIELRGNRSTRLQVTTPRSIQSNDEDHT